MTAFWPSVAATTNDSSRHQRDEDSGEETSRPRELIFQNMTRSQTQSRTLACIASARSVRGPDDDRRAEKANQRKRVKCRATNRIIVGKLSTVTAEGMAAPSILPSFVPSSIIVMVGWLWLVFYGTDTPSVFSVMLYPMTVVAISVAMLVILHVAFLYTFHFFIEPSIVDPVSASDYLILGGAVLRGSLWLLAVVLIGGQMTIACYLLASRTRWHRLKSTDMLFGFFSVCFWIVVAMLVSPGGCEHGVESLTTPLLGYIKNDSAASHV